MIERKQLIAALDNCVNEYLGDTSTDVCSNCPFYDGNSSGSCFSLYPIMKGALDVLKDQEPRLLKWTEVDKYDVVYIEVHEDEEGLGEWSGYGSYERQGPEPGTLQFAAIGKSMRLVTDPKNYNIYWRCWSSKPDRDQMDSTPWKDPY